MGRRDEVKAVLAPGVCLVLIAGIATLIAQQPQPNLLLITLDTLRADRVGAYGYKAGATPTLDRLAREGIRFEDATTQSPLTGPAHAALLTGMLPGRFNVRDNASTPLPSDVLTLAEHLKSTGYQTAAVVGAFVLDSAYGFGQGFDAFDARFGAFTAGDKLLVQRRAGEVVDAAGAWLAQAAKDRPFFLWVHLYDPHSPYDPPAALSGRFKAQPYDGEIAYTDTQVGRLVRLLEERNALDGTVVVAVADHGESLGEHGEAEHGIFLYEAVLRIPWIMRLPQRERAGAVVAEQVRAVDVMPTILDALRVRAPATPLDGESVLPVARGKPRRDPPPSHAETHYPKWHLGWSALTSLRVGEWKFVHGPKPELYDLRTDRNEQKNVIAERSSVAARLQEELRNMSATLDRNAVRPSPPDPETLARLRSLGYVGLAAAPAGGGSDPDPKDMIRAYGELKRLLPAALDDLRDGRADAAIARLKPLVRVHERSHDLHLFLGNAYVQKRQWKLALGEYAAAATLNPSTAAPHLASAQVLLQQGDLDAAARQIEKGAAIEPLSHEVPLMRGRLAERRDDLAAAFAEFQRAIALNANDPRPRALLANIALRLDMPAAAEQQFRALLGMNYQPARTFYGLGRVAEARGDRTAALAAYKQALAIDPGLAEAREAMAALIGPPERRRP